MDFFDREAHAQKQTKRLVWLFGLGVAAALVFNYAVLAIVIELFRHAHDWTTRPTGEVNRFWDPWRAVWITVATLISVAAGCYYKLRQLSEGGPAVAEMLGGRCINPDTNNLNEKKLCDVVGEMAIASGMPVPAVYVLDNERGINSFVAGHTRDDLAIGITRGGLVLLSRDEMQGMVAHEFSHVLNGDTRLNMRLMILLHGLLWPTILGRAVVMQAAAAIESDDEVFEPSESGSRMLLVPFWLIGAPGLFLARFIKSAICREREWLADAAAVQFTRNPAGIEGALKKVGGLLKQGRLDTPLAETASHLYLVSSDFEPWFNFTATHPQLEKRIFAIDAAFDGQFQHILSLPRPEVEVAAKLDKVYEESLKRARDNAKVREEFE